MWSPTHVHVTVQRARNLLTKGKHGTNDAFVTIALGKDKYQTSVKEKAHQDVEWHEECELQIPKQGNIAEIILTVLHRNFIAVDEFLGVVSIPLAGFDVYERPRNRWYELKSKPGKEKSKPRGELEVQVSFIVKAGSLTDLRKKHRSSLGQLPQGHSVGGSLLSIRSVGKGEGIMKLAKSMVRKSKKGDKDVAGDHEFRTSYPMSSQVLEDADPGVISEGEGEDDFTLDDLPHRSSGSSLNANQLPVNPVVGSLENLAGDALATKMETPKRRSWENSKTVLSSQLEEEEPDEKTQVNEFSIHASVGSSSSHVRQPTPTMAAPRGEEKAKEGSKLFRKLKQFRREVKVPERQTEQRVVIGGESNGFASVASRLSPEMLHKFDGKSKKDLIEIICSLQVSMEHQTKKLRDLEEYLDNLLLRVMETTPRILQNPYVSCKTQAKLSHY